MGKISRNDSTKDAITKMAEGNVGALQCLMDMAKENQVKLVINMHLLDELELYGSKIYMLWNDCCDRNSEEMDLVLSNYKAGILTKESIQSKLSGGRGIPFDNLVPSDRLITRR